MGRHSRESIALGPDREGSSRIYDIQSNAQSVSGYLCDIPARRKWFMHSGRCLNASEFSEEENCQTDLNKGTEGREWVVWHQDGEGWRIEGLWQHGTDLENHTPSCLDPSGMIFLTWSDMSPDYLTETGSPCRIVVRRQIKAKPENCSKLKLADLIWRTMLQSAFGMLSLAGFELSLQKRTIFITAWLTKAEDQYPLAQELDQMLHLHAPKTSVSVSQELSRKVENPLDQLKPGDLEPLQAEHPSHAPSWSDGFVMRYV